MAPRQFLKGVHGGAALSDGATPFGGSRMPALFSLPANDAAAAACSSSSSSSSSSSVGRLCHCCWRTAACWPECGRRAGSDSDAATAARLRGPLHLPGAATFGIAGAGSRRRRQAQALSAGEVSAERHRWAAEDTRAAATFALLSQVRRRSSRVYSECFTTDSASPCCLFADDACVPRAPGSDLAQMGGPTARVACALGPRLARQRGQRSGRQVPVPAFPAHRRRQPRRDTSLPAGTCTNLMRVSPFPCAACAGTPIARRRLGSWPGCFP